MAEHASCCAKVVRMLVEIQEKDEKIAALHRLIEAATR